METTTSIKVNHKSSKHDVVLTIGEVIPVADNKTDQIKSDLVHQAINELAVINKTKLL